MFGFDTKNVMGENVSLLIPQAYRKQHAIIVDYFEEGTRESNLSLNTESLTALKKSGEEFPIEAKISRLELATETIKTISISDISFRVEAEAVLLKYQEELEDKVKQRTFELQSSIEDLQSAQGLLVESEKMALLGRLVAGIAHELNTPIGKCVTAASYLEERITCFFSSF